MLVVILVLFLIDSSRKVNGASRAGEHNAAAAEKAIC